MNGNPGGKMRSFTGGQARQLDDGNPNSPGRDFSGICDADVGIWDENFERSTYFTRTAPLVVPSLLLCSRNSVHSPLLSLSSVLSAKWWRETGLGRLGLAWQLRAFNACGLRLCRNYEEQWHSITKMSKRKIMVRKEGWGHWQTG